MLPADLLQAVPAPGAELDPNAFSYPIVNAQIEHTTETGPISAARNNRTNNPRDLRPLHTRTASAELET